MLENNCVMMLRVVVSDLSDDEAENARASRHNWDDNNNESAIIIRVVILLIGKFSMTFRFLCCVKFFA